MLLEEVVEEDVVEDVEEEGVVVEVRSQERKLQKRLFHFFVFGELTITYLNKHFYCKEDRHFIV